jgi:hypothetical protein
MNDDAGLRLATEAAQGPALLHSAATAGLPRTAVGDSIGPAISIPVTAMKHKVGAFAVLAMIPFLELNAAATLVSDLGWLAGSWIGGSSEGTVYESHYSTPNGGVIVSASKETRNGRTVSTDFEIFYQKEGRIIFQPCPNGTKSPSSFPLVTFEALARRAVFENREHDFPQVFIFEQPTLDVLKITLQGPGKDGATKSIVYEFRRAM